MRLQSLLLVASLPLVATPAVARPAEFLAPGLVCRAWQIDDGLPDNSVASLLQTRSGHLWMGTYDGFVRFDGRRFHSVSLPLAGALLVEGIIHLHEDRSSRLWGVSDRGRVFALEDGNVRIVGADPKMSGLVFDMAEDGAGNLWIPHPTGRLVRVDRNGLDSQRDDARAVAVDEQGILWLLTKQGILFQHRKTGWAQIPSSDGFQNSRCTSIASDGKGRVWVARDNELWRITDGRFQCIAEGTEFAHIEAIHPAPDHSVWVRQKRSYRRLLSEGTWQGPAVETGITWVQCARCDFDGALWLGEMGGGVFKVGPQNQFQRYRAGEGLASNRVSSIEIDREGSVWFGFYDGGLQQARPRFVEGVQATQGGPLVPTSLCEDQSGNLWLAGHGGALVRMEKDSFARVPFSGTTFQVQTRVISCDRSARIWAGTFGQGLWRLDGDEMRRIHPEEPGLREPRALFTDSRDRLWIGTDAGTFYIENETLHRVALPFSPGQPKVCGFAEGQAGDIWIATEGAGILCWKDEKIRTPPELAELRDTTITMLFVDDSGALWMGARGIGILRYHQKKLDVLSSKSGFPDSPPLAMCDDENGHFWLTSRNGITRVSKQALHACADGHTDEIEEILILDKSDGLATAQCMGGVQPAICRARDGSIWVPTSRETVRIDPQRLRINTQAPLIAVDRFIVDGRPHVFLGTDLVFAAGTTRIEIQYAGLGLAAPDKVRHRHRLSGLKDIWTDDGTYPHITYAHLPPGQYRLEIEATNEHGISTKKQAASFRILPHVWQRLPFQIACGFALTGAGVLAGRRIVARRWQRRLAEAEQRRALERERARIARDIHDELGASLTRITLLSQDGRNGAADRVLKEIQSTAREVTRAMDEVVWAVNPQHDSVEGLLTYLQRHAQRFLAAAGVRCRFDLPLDADLRNLGAGVRHQVFLAFKESLNNVVRHAGATEVRVRVVTEAEQLLIEVADDGRGFALSEQLREIAPDRLENGNGLQSMCMRLADVGGRCEIRPVTMGGTLVRFTLPLSSAARTDLSES